MEHVVVGNCQAWALELMLTTSDAFASRFELMSFPAVHELPEAMVGQLHEAVAGAAAVVVQRIDEDYRDGIGLGTETLARIADRATVVRWPSVFWAGYVPELFYLRDGAGGLVVDGLFDYHDRSILEAYGRGAGVAATCALLAIPKLLFFTMNHPANTLIAHIAQQVVELLGLPGRVAPERVPHELLGPTFYPLHANHVRALELVELNLRPAALRTPADAI